MKRKGRGKMELKDVEKISLDVLKNRKRFLPQATVINHAGRVTLVALAIENEDQKAQAIESLRTVINNEGSEEYYLGMEAWVTQINKADPSKKPIKREALVVSHFKKGSSSEVVMNFFSKTESGEIVITERVEIPAVAADSEIIRQESPWDVVNG